ncbi:MAG: hypothetical protein Q8N39_00385 [Pelolinea sp.]|nr:hypothetical protein [Pelolinea sp.]
MEKIKSFIKKPIALGIAGLVLGLIIGLVVLGWGLWPLQWLDAGPDDLQIDYQRDYLCMTIDSYIRNQDNELVQLRWQGLGEKGHDLLETLTPAVCRFSSGKEIKAFGEIVTIQAVPQAEGTQSSEVPVTTAEGVTPEVVAQLPTEQPKEGGFSIIPLVILMALTLIVGGVFVFLMVKKGKSAGGNQPKIKKSRPDSRQAAVKTAQEPEAFTRKEPPLSQFMTTYRQNDDLYDDSFSIDSINGEFLGECGVGIAETIGVGEPKKVTALEVWLFDKNDIQTVTKVLMSEHANNDPAIRQRLLSKGEPIVVEPGMRFVMETASLQLEAKIVDMVYARGPLPENSYFSRLTLEISVWAK